MLAELYLHVSFCFLVQPCLNFGWQLKLPVAVSGVIFSESMKIERFFQFTLMTCYLPHTYQNHTKNEPKKFIFQEQKKIKNKKK